MRWFRRALMIVLFLAAVPTVLWITGERTGKAMSRPPVSKSADAISHGAAAFAGEAFGGVSMHALESNALPWKLTAAALVLDEQQREPSAAMNQATLARILKRFGFLYPDHIDNLPSDVAQLKSQLPLGMTFGYIAPIGGSRVMVSNLGCAACHAGVTYQANGMPQNNHAVLGMPNTSLNLEAYTQAVFVAMRRHLESEKLLPAVEKLFPDMDARERHSLEWIVLPIAKKRIGDLAGMDRAMPFPNGVPGSTNGVAALKMALKSPLAGGGPKEAGFVSIPDLSDRVWKTSLLVDGVYAVPHLPPRYASTAANLNDQHLRSLAEITTFFTVPSMGVSPSNARSSIDDATNIMHFLNAYKPQIFPGPINRELASRGAQTYGAHCAACHGQYDTTHSQPTLTRFPNWIGSVDTDMLRAQVFDVDLVNAINRTPYRDWISVNRGRGYVAPPLTGIWASAPYLHNGSVTSLAALVSPETRSKKFQVGGHALDFNIVGLLLDEKGQFPNGYVPYSEPVWVDTQQPGHRNTGHRFGETLSIEEKHALIEFLKTL
jgi:hypothetical protein